MFPVGWCLSWQRGSARRKGNLEGLRLEHRGSGIVWKLSRGTGRATSLTQSPASCPLRCVALTSFGGKLKLRKAPALECENYHTHLALVRSLQEMCLDETWRERNRVLQGGAFPGGAALSVLFVAQGHGREGTTVTIHVMLALP